MASIDFALSSFLDRRHRVRAAGAACGAIRLGERGTAMWPAKGEQRRGEQDNDPGSCSVR